MINNVVLVSGVQQSDSVIHIHVSILFQVLFSFTLLQNIELSSLCCTVAPCWLSILNIAVCMSISNSQSIPFFYNHLTAWRCPRELPTPPLPTQDATLHSELSVKAPGGLLNKAFYFRIVLDLQKIAKIVQSVPLPTPYMPSFPLLPTSSINMILVTINKPMLIDYY